MAASADAKNATVRFSGGLFFFAAGGVETRNRIVRALAPEAFDRARFVSAGKNPGARVIFPKTPETRAEIGPAFGGSRKDPLSGGKACVWRKKGI